MLYAQISLDSQLGSDTRLGLDRQTGSNLLLKLHVLVYLFAAYQAAELRLQFIIYKQVHLCTTYTLKLHVL